MSEFLNLSEQLESAKEVFQNTNLTAADFDLKSLFGGLEWNAKPAGLRHWAVIEKGVDAKAFTKAHRAWRITACLGDHPENVREFVDLFCTKHKVKIGFDNRLSATGLGREPTLATLANSIWLCGAEIELPLQHRTREGISIALEDYSRRHQDSQIDAAQAVIVADNAPPADAEWLKLAQAFSDATKQSDDYTIRVLQTSIWQVKRKLVDDPRYPVTDHLMAILTGPQRSGKTSLWTRFFSPIRDFVYPADFKQLRDGKNFDLWRHPAVFFDEMAYASLADIDEVKNAITSNTRTNRLHHSHSAANIRNSSTFFGATNGVLGSIIFDKTGLRRFAPIATKQAPTGPDNTPAGPHEVNWAAIGEIDFLRLWQSVDHTAGHPLQSDATARAEWLEIIEGERAQDAPEMFIRSFQPQARTYRLDELFDHFRQFTVAENERDISKRVFSKRLKELADNPAFPFKTRLRNGYTVYEPKTGAAAGDVDDNVINIAASSRPDLTAFLDAQARRV